MVAMMSFDSIYISFEQFMALKLLNARRCSIMHSYGCTSERAVSLAFSLDLKSTWFSFRKWRSIHLLFGRCYYLFIMFKSGKGRWLRWQKAIIALTRTCTLNSNIGTLQLYSNEVYLEKTYKHSLATNICHSSCALCAVSIYGFLDHWKEATKLR